MQHASDTDITIRWVEVTPEVAHDWLGYNTHNRRPRHRSISAYAADMKAGEWVRNGESIKFAKDGTLLDGQNRLLAVIEADVTVPLLVIRGLPHDTQDTMDGGIKRKFSDVLNLRGETNYSILAAVVRRVTIWEAGFRSTRGNFAPSNAQLLQTLEKYPWLREISASANLTASHCALPGSIIGFGWWLFSQIDQEDAEAFFARLADDQNMAKGNPIYELRKAAANSKNVRGQRSETFLTAILIKAWNAYRDGDTVGLLTYKPGGARPEKFPEPR